MMITIQAVYPIIALLIVITALQAALRTGGSGDHNPDTNRWLRVTSRWRETAFWAVLAALFAAADFWPDSITGAGVLLLAVLAPASGVRESVAELRQAGGNRLFIPLLLIPLLTLLGLWWLPQLSWRGQPLVAGAQASLIALAMAALLMWWWVQRQTKTTLVNVMSAGTPLFRAMGWALLLPLMLATLGAVFAKLQIGQAVADGVSAVMPMQVRLAAVLSYGLGMALLTVLMGNAFAAWPIMTAGIGVPILIQQHGAEPASLAAIGMLCGYCGTLLTPMAANYNIVPAALLDLSDRYAVIRAQVATALPLLLCNLALLYWLPFRQVL